MKLNCTTRLCLSIFSNQFERKQLSWVRTYHFEFPNESEFYGLKYTLFYATEKYQNIHALFSPFKLIDWVYIIFNCCLIALVLWLVQFKINPFFWMISVILEQDDDKRNAVTRANAFVIFAWLICSISLRNAYTSNLYTYMTLEVEPSNLPRSFETLIESTTSTKLATQDTIGLIEIYKNKALKLGSVQKKLFFQLI